jgi:hypothetical protein
VFVSASTSSSGLGRVRDTQLALASLPDNIQDLREEYEHHAKTSPDPIEWLDTTSSIIRRASHLQAENIRGWQGTYRPKAGWGAAMDAIDSVGAELQKLGGVEMVFGRRVAQPISSNPVGKDRRADLPIELVSPARDPSYDPS